MKTKEDWLLNNPHCKQIESCSKSLSKKCICKKDEPKQETTSEGFHRISKEFDYSEFDFVSFKIGAEWQQERMYSEEDIREAFIAGVDKESYNGANFDEWLEKIKKEIIT